MYLLFKNTVNILVIKLVRIGLPTFSLVDDYPKPGDFYRVISPRIYYLLILKCTLQFSIAYEQWKIYYF